MKKEVYTRLKPDVPVSSSVFLDNVMQRLNIDFSLPETQIQLQWEFFIGKHLYDYCKFSGIKNGTLFIVCENASYSATVRMCRNEILKKISSTFPELNVVKISARLKTT